MTRSVTTNKTLPQADGDFYAIGTSLSEEDQALLRRVRGFLEVEVAPIISEYWIREELPHQLIPKPVALVAWSQQNMADYKYPRHIEFRTELPMTATGKELKSELRS